MSFFKDCDIRAKVGDASNELDEDKAYRIGKSIGTIVNSKDYKYSNEVIVGGDIRLSTESLKGNLMKGLIKSGVKVIDIGICSTPFFYFAIEKLGIDNGIMVTASHNPKEFNGFKFVLGPLPVLKEDIANIGDVYSREKFIRKDGEIEKVNLKKDYINFVEDFFNFKYNGKVVVDFSNG